MVDGTSVALQPDAPLQNLLDSSRTSYYVFWYNKLLGGRVNKMTFSVKFWSIWMLQAWLE